MGYSNKPSDSPKRICGAGQPSGLAVLPAPPSPVMIYSGIGSMEETLPVDKGLLFK
jgi:hypothetical protein